MNATAVIETLRRAARLCRAMNDPAMAIDLYDLSARVAVRSAIGTVAPGDPRRRDLEMILSAERRFPILTLAQARDYPALTLAGAGRLAAVGKLLDQAFEDGAVKSWTIARDACAALRTCAIGCLPCAVTDGGDPRPLWRLALSALEELLQVTPVPLVLEPVAAIGQHARDKVMYRSPGVAAGLQDAGWVYDRMTIDRDRLAIARVALPPVQQGPFLRRYAEHHFDRGDLESAERFMREGLAVNPNAEDHNALLRYLLASPSADEKRFFAESRRWAELYAGEDKLSQVVYRNDRSPDRPLRIGYMCDFVHTPLAQHTLVPVFEAHDRKNFRVYYYNHGTDSATARAVSDVYRDVRHLDDEHIVGLIHDDQVDLLIDLNGRLRVKNRYEVLCRKPAPVQVNWFNLLASTGLRAFDFLITEQLSLPKTKQHLCTEEIVYLDCQVAGAWRLPEDPPIAPQPCLSKGVFVFASFGAAFKNNAQVLDLWIRMLREIPGTLLYLKNLTFYTPAFKHQIRDYFVERGVPADRLRLEHRSDFHEMRALYADVDLGVDTFPYGNGSTSINALWQGVPTVTLMTDEWRGRTTAAIMTDAGLSEFIVKTPDEYIERARHYTRYPDQLVEIRASIRQRLTSSGSGHFNVPRFTRDLEAAYRFMWRRWLEKETSRAA